MERRLCERYPVKLETIILNKSVGSTDLGYPLEG